MVYTHGVRSTQTQWNATNTGGWGYRGWGGMGGGMTTATETKIPVGTLVVDLVNPKSKELVWRGTASDQISASGAEEGQVQNAMASSSRTSPRPSSPQDSDVRRRPRSGRLFLVPTGLSPSTT